MSKDLTLNYTKLKERFIVSTATLTYRKGKEKLLGKKMSP
jgi:hypothetical protein